MTNFDKNGQKMRFLAKSEDFDQKVTFEPK